MQFSHRVERCTRCHRVTELFFCRWVDEYLCEHCCDEVAKRLDDLADEADQRVADIKSGKIVEGPQLLIDLLGKF